MPEHHADVADLEGLNLLNTIKVPKNLAQLTKNLPKSNYVTTRQMKYESANLNRLQSEPVSHGNRLLPQINSMKDIKVTDSLSLQSHNLKSELESQIQSQVNLVKKEKVINKYKPLLASVDEQLQANRLKNLQSVEKQKAEERFKS